MILKAAHLDPFYKRNLKAKILLQQVDNMIVDVVEASKEQRIWYMISRLGELAVEWVATYMDNERYTIFKRFENL